MQLQKIQQITGTLKIKTGLHIGGADTTIKIGGIDNTVIKNPLTNYPIIPGSSLKGKIRSLLEMVAGHNGESPLAPKDIENEKVNDIETAKNTLRLFGASGDSNSTEYGIARLSFYDCAFNDDWEKQHKNSDSLTASLTEEKAENTINRITGAATNPRFTERVPAGAEFDFILTIRFFDEDDKTALTNTLLGGLKLLTLDSLGGSGSRGYGKISFENLTIGDTPIDLNTINPFDKG